MGDRKMNEAVIDVLNLMRGEIDALPGLKDFHRDDPVYDEAIEIAKDKVFGAIEDLITYVETDDSDEGDDVDEDSP
jgi:hypothetical protein